MDSNREDRYDVWLSLVINFTKVNVSEFFKKIYSVIEWEDDRISSKIIYDNKDRLANNIGFLKESERNGIKNFPLEKAEEILIDCEKNAVDIVTYSNIQYPEKLKNIFNPPIVLYRKGKYKNIDDLLSIAIVGTRKPSVYAIRATNLIAQDLAISNSVVVSGQALGIDSAAHQGALDAGGYTVAFAGCGLDIDYPMGNRELRERIIKNGVVYSEHPPKTPPSGWHFPIRNRLISGFSDGVFITEGYHYSGSIHTARHALEQGRDVFALPGDVFSPKSEASFRLLKEGANPVMNCLDILEHYLLKYSSGMNFIGVRRNYYGGLGSSAAPLKKKRPKTITKKTIVPINNPRFLNSEELLKKGLLYEEIKVYNSLVSNDKHLDEIINEVEIESNLVLSCLTKLEIAGVVTSLPGKRYKIKNI